MNKKFFIFLMFFCLCNPVWGYINFDGADDYLTTGYTTPVDQTTFSIGVLFRVNGIDANEHYLVGMISDNPVSSDALIQVGFDSTVCTQDHLLWGVREDGTGIAAQSICSTNSVDDNAWHYAIGTFNVSGNMVLYVDTDTVSAAVGVLADGTKDFDQPFYIGCRNGRGTPQLYIAGDIEEVTFWETELSATEAQNIINAKLKRLPLQYSPVRHYPIDDGPDGTSADGDTISDLTGTGNGTGIDGANNTGLTWKAGEVLSYPPAY